MSGQADCDANGGIDVNHGLTVFCSFLCCFPPICKGNVSEFQYEYQQFPNHKTKGSNGGGAFFGPGTTGCGAFLGTAATKGGAFFGAILAKYCYKK